MFPRGILVLGGNVHLFSHCPTDLDRGHRFSHRRDNQYGDAKIGLDLKGPRRVTYLISISLSYDNTNKVLRPPMNVIARRHRNINNLNRIQMSAIFLVPVILGDVTRFFVIRRRQGRYRRRNYAIPPKNIRHMIFGRLYILVMSTNRGKTTTTIVRCRVVNVHSREKLMFYRNTIVSCPRNTLVTPVRTTTRNVSHFSCNRTRYYDHAISMF